MNAPFHYENAASIGHTAGRDANRWRVPRITISLIIAAVILALPSSLAGFAEVSSLWVPLEVPVLALLALMLTGTSFSLLRATTTFLLAAMSFLKLADIGTDIAFQRPFNPYLDLKILTDGWNLLSGTVGAHQAIGIICAGMFAWLLVAAAFFWSFGGFSHFSTSGRRKLSLISGIFLLAGLTVLAVQDPDRRQHGVEANAIPYFAQRITMVKDSLADLARFEDDLKQDPVAAGPHFSALAGTDVVIIFIESYGRSALEDPRYAADIKGRLASIGQGIKAAGLEARSGWLSSSTVGGLSWLAHGTLLSGLWVDSQARYDRMITSNRRSLNTLFRTAGWRTAALMPAITLDWPEAGYFGYDSIRAAAGLGYAGKPFNWVTMPDQFTLEAFERLERQGREKPGYKPVMAEIALISSHAPWTPVPTLIDWDKIGDGTVFNAQAKSGDPPSVIWADPNRVRAQYAASVDYTLETLGSYMARYGKNTLFILLGDHQPAAIITGEGASRDVPVHIVSDDPELLKRFDKWQWQPGMMPLKETPAYRMDEFRERLVKSFD